MNKKSCITTTVILLIIVAIAATVLAVVTDGFKNWNVRTWFDFGKDKLTETVPLPKFADNGGASIENATENGMLLTVTKIATEAYAANGITPLAETAYTLTATITPSDTTDKTVNWSVNFKNFSSTWATDKIVTDYVTVTPTSDGALTANVECKAAFAEKIQVEVKVRNDNNISATCNVDYKQRYIETYSVTNYSDMTHPGINVSYLGNEREAMYCPSDTSQGYHMNSATKSPVKYYSQLSDTYTLPLEEDIKYHYYVKLNADFAADLALESAFAKSTMAKEWTLYDETTGNLAAAKENNYVSGTIEKTVIHFMKTLCSSLSSPLAPVPDSDSFWAYNLTLFKRVAKKYVETYHFQIKVEAEFGDESNETIANFYFPESTLTIPASVVSLNNSTIVF